MIMVRHCSICDLNWPYHNDYIKCPKCQQKTSSISKKPGTDCLSVAEAKSIAVHMKFQNYIENETEEDRRKRQEHNRYVEERVDEAKIVLVYERFREVIQGAGFTDDERKDIERLEAQLPMAHINREDDDA